MVVFRARLQETTAIYSRWESFSDSEITISPKDVTL